MRENKKVKSVEPVEKTGVPIFFRELSPVPTAQVSFSNPSTLASPRRSSTTVPRPPVPNEYSRPTTISPSSCAILSNAASYRTKTFPDVSLLTRQLSDTVATSTTLTPKNIPHSGSFKLSSAASKETKVFPGSSAKLRGAQKKRVFPLKSVLMITSCYIPP